MHHMLGLSPPNPKGLDFIPHIIAGFFAALTPTVLKNGPYDFIREASSVRNR